MYELKRRVRFYETDGMRVVYHGNYLNWLEEARVEYLRKAHIVLDDWMNMGIVFPIVELHIKYLQSARYDDCVTVRTWLTHADRAKLVFRYEIVRDIHTDGQRAHRPGAEGADRRAPADVRGG